MAGLEDLSLGKAASELEGLASVLKPRKPTIGGLYLPEDPPVQEKEKSILKEGTDAFINSLGPQNVRLMMPGKHYMRRSKEKKMMKEAEKGAKSGGASGAMKKRKMMRRDK